MSDPGCPLSTQNYLWFALSQTTAPASYYQMWSVPPADNNDHAFALWQDFTDDTVPNQGLRVRNRVIDFFTQYLHD